MKTKIIIRIIILACVAIFHTACSTDDHSLDSRKEIAISLPDQRPARQVTNEPVTRTTADGELGTAWANGDVVHILLEFDNNNISSITAQRQGDTWIYSNSPVAPEAALTITKVAAWYLGSHWLDEEIAGDTDILCSSLTDISLSSLDGPLELNDFEHVLARITFTNLIPGQFIWLEDDNWLPTFQVDELGYTLSVPASDFSIEAGEDGTAVLYTGLNTDTEHLFNVSAVRPSTTVDWPAFNPGTVVGNGSGLSFTIDCGQNGSVNLENETI